MKRLLVILALVMALSSCAGPQVKTPDANFCTVAGIFQAGIDCATTNSGSISSLDFMEFVDFLEPQPERTCVQKPGFNVCASDQSKGKKVTLPARAGAIMESDDDLTAMKTALEQACVELKDRCVPEMKAIVAAVGAKLEAVRAALHPQAAKKKGL